MKVIVGAGLAGLTCAKVLSESGAEVEVFEASDGVGGVRAANGEREADAVVVAVEAPEAARLSGEEAPGEGLGQTCVYYACEPGALGGGKKIMLNAEEGFLNNAVEISRTAPGYAPEGRGLVSAVALGANAELSDEEACRRGLEEIARRAPEADLSPLAVYRIPFAQPPGVHAGSPDSRTKEPGLYLAGEYTEDSSINGSMLSGERAAVAVLAASREAVA